MRQIIFIFWSSCISSIIYGKIWIYVSYIYYLIWLKYRIILWITYQLNNYEWFEDSRVRIVLSGLKYIEKIKYIENKI